MFRKIMKQIKKISYSRSRGYSRSDRRSKRYRSFSMSFSRSDRKRYRKYSSSSRGRGYHPYVGSHYYKKRRYSSS